MNQYYANPFFAAGDMALHLAMSAILAGLLFTGFVRLVLYVFRAIGLHQIARRRGIRAGWLSWIPVADAWVVGSLSDQYQYVVHGKYRWNRVFLLISRAVHGLTGAIAFWISASVMMMNVFGIYVVLDYPIVLRSLTLLLGPVSWICCLVFRVLSMYDLYRSCNPGNGLIYCILGTIFPFLDPFFIFSCREKDDGMPPRKQ